jgi:preprotein translocase subunit SecA
MSALEEMRIWTSEKVGGRMRRLSLTAQEMGKDTLEWVVQKAEPLSYDGRKIRKISKTAEGILANLDKYSSMTEEQLQLRTVELRDYIQSAFDDIEDRILRENDYVEINNSAKKARKLREAIVAEVLPEAYSLAHQAIMLSNLPSNKGGVITELTGAQIKGGISMMDNVIDMKTGEGKTLTALMPAYLRSLMGEAVHISTVNEYLSFRDYSQAEGILGKLGLSVGITLSDEGYMQSFSEEVAGYRTEIRGEVLTRMRAEGVQEQFETYLKEKELKAMNQHVMGLVMSEIPDASGDDKNALHNKYLNAVFNNRLNEMMVQQLDGETDQRLMKLVHQKNMELKRKGYACDVTFGYHSEFAFDYLRDHTQKSMFEMVNPDQRFGFAIIDEVDNILIDAAQTPHKLSELVEKKYSDRQMHYVKAGVAQFMSEQREMVESLESTVMAHHTRLQEQITGVISTYAQENSISVDSTIRKLRTEGELVEVKAKIRELQKEPSQAIGKGLFELQHITKNSEVFDALFDHYQAFFFREANKEQEDRQKTLENLDYIIEEGAINITDKGVEKLYASGLLQSGEIRVSRDSVITYMRADGLDASDPTKEDYMRYLETVATKFELPNYGALLKRIDDGDLDFTIQVDAPQNAEMFELLTTFMKANEFFKEGREYVVSDDEVIVIDSSTHRPQPGTRYNNGIHEALECIHDVKIHPPSANLGSISLPKFFQLYSGITGMSGSVLSVEDELQETYGIETVAIAPNEKLRRIDEGYAVYATVKAKNAAILSRVEDRYQQGRPVLLGVQSSTEAETYKQMLVESGFNPEDIAILSAKTALEDGFEEAQLIRQAGTDKRITIATNMAGRGTDIKLSGIAAKEGGLDVVLTYNPKSKRSIEQFIGRAGRLGDPGSSKVYSSLEDPFFGHYQGTSAQRVNARLGADEIEEDFCADSWFLKQLYTNRINKIIGVAESKSRSGRVQTLKYDNMKDVMRRKFYALRESVMEQTPNELLEDMRLENYDVMVGYDAGGDVTNKTFEHQLTQTFDVGGREHALQRLDSSWVAINADLDSIEKSIGLHGHAQQNPEMVFSQILHNMYRDLRDDFGEHLVEMYQ